jgi:hypothetical protein
MNRDDVRESDRLVEDLARVETFEERAAVLADLAADPRSAS